MTTTTGPLAGIRVLELGVFIAGPGAASVLASLGAEVIKLEHVDGDLSRQVGDGGRGMVAAYNRGKRSLAVDLRTDVGRDVLRRLLRRSDVFLHNMRPSSAVRLGVGPDDIHAIAPQVVYGAISGYGSDTSQRDRPGLDIAAQAESGLLSLNGEADRDPVRVGFTVVDAATAHILAQGIAAALFDRTRTGHGAVVEVPLFHVATQLTAALWAEYFASGEVPSRKGNGQPGLAPAADLYRTRDGHIVLSAYTADHWAKLCAAVGMPQLHDDPRFADNAARVAHRTELAALLESVFTTRDTEECATWLSGHGLVAGPVRTLEQAFQAPIGHELGVFRRGDDDRWYVTTPYRVDGRPCLNDGPVPDTGDDTVAILEELGFDDATIDDHLRADVVRSSGTRLTAGVADTGGDR